MFTGGFASTSAEIVLLISFQIIYGYVYSMLGIILTVFMIGLALGTFTASKKIKAMLNNSDDNIMIKKKLTNILIKVQFIIVLYMLSLPLAIKFVDSTAFTNGISPYIIGLYTFIISVIVGAQFSIGAFLYPQQRDTVTISKSHAIAIAASETYSADMIGASLGGLTVAAFLIPLVGVFNVCYFCSALAAISLIIVFFKRKSI